MKRITVTLNVDESILLEESGQENLNDAISQELNWLHDSGMYVQGWEFLNQREQEKKPEPELAVLVERDYKGTYERFALTMEEFRKAFTDQYEHMPEPGRAGESYTLRPMVHLWYCQAGVNDSEWDHFFTDMSYGLPDSDIKAGNLARIDYSMMKELKLSVAEAVNRANVGQRTINTLDNMISDANTKTGKSVPRPKENPAPDRFQK